jgi:hypothetical protein
MQLKYEQIFEDVWYSCGRGIQLKKIRRTNCGKDTMYIKSIIGVIVAAMRIDNMIYLKVGNANCRLYQYFEARFIFEHKIYIDSVPDFCSGWPYLRFIDDHHYELIWCRDLRRIFDKFICQFMDAISYKYLSAAKVFMPDIARNYRQFIGGLEVI